MKISNGLKIFTGLEKKLVKIAALGILLIPSIVSAQWTTIGGPASLPSADLKDVLANIIVGILGFVGIASIIYLIYGGIRYVTSAGNDSEMQDAKNIIMYAILGLFITASSYAIVKTVVDIVK